MSDFEFKGKFHNVKLNPAKKPATGRVSYTEKLKIKEESKRILLDSNKNSQDILNSMNSLGFEVFMDISMNNIQNVYNINYIQALEKFIYFRDLNVISREHTRLNKLFYNMKYQFHDDGINNIINNMLLYINKYNISRLTHILNRDVASDVVNIYEAMKDNISNVALTLVYYLSRIDISEQVHTNIYSIIIPSEVFTQFLSAALRVKNDMISVADTAPGFIRDTLSLLNRLNLLPTEDTLSILRDMMINTNKYRFNINLINLSKYQHILRLKQYIETGR